jgi:hypothetical protein
MFLNSFLMYLVTVLDVLNFVLQLLIFFLQFFVENFKVILHFLGGGLYPSFPLIATKVIGILSDD